MTVGMDEEKGRRPGRRITQINYFLFRNYLVEHVDNSFARNAELRLRLCSVYWEMSMNGYTYIRTVKSD